MWVFSRVTTNNRIQIFYPTKIGADGYVLFSTSMLISIFCGVPWTRILLPSDLVFWRAKVDVHVSASES
jgi:hypothetical protein